MYFVDHTNLDGFRQRALGRAVVPGLSLNAAGSVKIESADPASRLVAMTISNNEVDRSGDVIDPAGWRLDAYRRNPVVLWNSMDNKLPAIGRMVDIRVQGRQLRGVAEFTASKSHPAAETVFRLVSGGFLRGVRVAFEPIEWAISDDPTRPQGINFLRHELLAVMICNYGENLSALVDSQASDAVLQRGRSQTATQWPKGSTTTGQHSIAEHLQELKQIEAQIWADEQRAEIAAMLRSPAPRN